MFVIDKDCEKPAAKKSKYPFDEMVVGDSFFIEGGKERAVASAASQFGKRHRMKFSVWKMEGGHRVWRVS